MDITPRPADRSRYARTSRTLGRLWSPRYLLQWLMVIALCCATGVVVAVNPSAPTESESELAAMLSQLQPSKGEAKTKEKAGDVVPVSHTAPAADTDRKTVGLSQPTFLQPAPSETNVTSMSPSMGSPAADEVWPEIMAGSFTISDRDESWAGQDRLRPQTKPVRPAVTQESQDEESTSARTAWWSPFSARDDAESDGASTDVDANADAIVLQAAAASEPGEPATASTPSKALNTVPRSGLLGQLLGLSNPQAEPHSAPAAPKRAVQQASATSPESSSNAGGGGNSLIRQAVTGQAATPADDNSRQRLPAQAPASTSQGSPALPAEVRAAEQQIMQNAKSGVRSLWDQLTLAQENNATSEHRNGQTAAASELTPNNNSGQQGLAGLWRPMTMTTSGATSQNATSANDRPTTEAVDRRPEAERVPRLMRPMFYATNERDRRRQLATQTASATPSRSLDERIGDWSLMRQFSLTANENLPSSPQPGVNGPSGAWSDSWSEPWVAMGSQLTMTNEPIRPTAIADGAIQQVAFLQDDESGGGLEPDQLNLPNNESDDSAEGDGESGEGALADAEKLGAEPEDNSLQFLRTQTVLLEPGQTRCDIGVEYILTELDFPRLFSPMMGSVAVEDVEFKARELAIPMEIRYGLLRRVQLFLQVPVGWSNTQVTFTEGTEMFDAFDNDGGLGDISWGATIQLRDGTADCPYVIGTLSATAPTGGDPFTGVVAPATSGPSLGNGFWSVAANLTWIRVYDPLVVYYGLGTRRYFEHRYVGLEILPGQEYNYTMGVGFSVTERVTLSTQFFGTYAEEIKVDGDRLEGSNLEPMTIRMAATISKPKNRIVEPFVAFGLTDDASEANFGITWTF